MDLLSAFRSSQIIDILTFLPPYVPTTTDALEAAVSKASGERCECKSIEEASWMWAGGPHGRALLERLIPALPSLLSPSGVAYLLFCDVEWLTGFAAAHGLAARAIALHSEHGDHFAILRCEHAGAA